MYWYLIKVFWITLHRTWNTIQNIFWVQKISVLWLFVDFWTKPGRKIATKKSTHVWATTWRTTGTYQLLPKWNHAWFLWVRKDILEKWQEITAVCGHWRVAGYICDATVAIRDHFTCTFLPCTCKESKLDHRQTGIRTSWFRLSCHEICQLWCGLSTGNLKLLPNAVEKRFEWNLVFAVAILMSEVAFEWIGPHQPVSGAVAV